MKLIVDLKLSLTFPCLLNSFVAAHSIEICVLPVFLWSAILAIVG